MSAEVEISSPIAFGCLPTSTATVSGRYQIPADAVLPRNPPAEPSVLNTNRFKVSVTVGGGTPAETWVAGLAEWDDWAVTFDSLTAAEDVTVTATLLDTMSSSGATTELDEYSVAHVCVSNACHTDPYLDLVGARPVAAAGPVGVGVLPAAAAPFLHRTVRCRYPIGADGDIHRVLAVVTRVDLVGGKPVSREVWAAVEASMKGGVAAAVIPLPPAATADTYYEYHFALFKNTTNALLFRYPAVPL